MGLVLMFLYVPIFVLIVFSFNETKSRSVFSGFTLDWYAKLFRNEVIISSLMNTIIIAVIASIAATLLGTLAAIGINSMRKVPKAIVMNITNMPIVNPEIVTGVSLMLLFVFFAARMNLEFGFVTLVIAHITFDVPYVILNVMPKFRQMDPNLFEAAQDLGCSPFTALRKVILPEIMPGVVSGITMVFVPAMTTFVISNLLGGGKILLIGNVIEQAFTSGSNWHLGSGLSLVLMVFIFISMAILAKYDPEGSNVV